MNRNLKFDFFPISTLPSSARMRSPFLQGAAPWVSSWPESVLSQSLWFFKQTPSGPQDSVLFLCNYPCQLLFKFLLPTEQVTPPPPTGNCWILATSNGGGLSGPRCPVLKTPSWYSGRRSAAWRGLGSVRGGWYGSCVHGRAHGLLSWPWRKPAGTWGQSWCGEAQSLLRRQWEAFRWTSWLVAESHPHVNPIFFTFIITLEWKHALYKFPSHRNCVRLIRTMPSF